MEQLQKFRTLRDETRTLNFRITFADLSFNNRPSNSSESFVNELLYSIESLMNSFIHHIGNNNYRDI